MRVPSRAIQYVGFQGGSSLSSGVTGAYLSARYESRREETDWTVVQYLKGDTELNPSEELSERVRDDALLDRIVRDLRLQKLLNMPRTRSDAARSEEEARGAVCSIRTA